MKTCYCKLITWDGSPEPCWLRMDGSGEPSYLRTFRAWLLFWCAEPFVEQVKLLFDVLDEALEETRGSVVGLELGEDVQHPVTTGKKTAGRAAKTALPAEMEIEDAGLAVATDVQVEHSARGLHLVDV